MQSSSTYCAVLDGTGEVYCAIGDMSANDTVTIDWVRNRVTTNLSIMDTIGRTAGISLFQCSCTLMSSSGLLQKVSLL